MERAGGASEPRLCPGCGHVLRPELDEAPALGMIAMEVAYWLVLALILGVLWSSGAAEDLQMVLGVAVVAVWFYLRARHRAARRRAASGQARHYYCENCGRRFDGDELRKMG